MGIIVPVLTLVFILFTSVSHAASKPRMILVGGYVGAWKVPDSPNKTLNHWAENTRFKVTDILVWKYDMKIDSVLQVTKEDYEKCNTTKPLKRFKDGDSKFELEKSGPYFFISGAPGNCDKGEKLHVVVLSESNYPTVSPIGPPPPSPIIVPAPAHNAAVRFTVGSGVFLTAVAIGLAMV